MNREEFQNNYQPNFGPFFEMLQAIGQELNSRKNRFDKADLVERGFVRATAGLEWSDEIGYDLMDSKRGIKFELKSQANCLYTPKGRVKSKTSEIKLSNSLSQKIDHKPSEEADYLIIIDSSACAVALIPYALVLGKYTKSKLDGFSCQIPMEELDFLATPSEFTLQNSGCVLPSYAKQKELLQERYVGGFFHQ